MSRGGKLWDPVRQEYCDDAGEVTVGHGVGPPRQTVTPRIVGAANVMRFKALFGVCPKDRCMKEAGHNGDCT